MIDWLNTNAGFFTLLVAFLTLIVAIITAIIAVKTYRSQENTEKLQIEVRDSQLHSEQLLKEVKELQTEARDSQIRSEQIQLRATEIQNRMDARDLEFRKSRSAAAMNHLRNIINSATNRISKDSTYDDLANLMSGWQDDLMNLPDCKLKEQAADVLQTFVAPGGGMPDGVHMHFIHNNLIRLRNDLEGHMLNGCREAINNMK